jgi:hypothetical protein
MNKKAAIYSLISTVVTLVLTTEIVSVTLNLRSQNASPSTGSTSSASQAVASSVETQPAISTQQASDLATSSAGPGESLASQPTLVLFNGDVAYEAKLEDGNVVYLSAADGSVKYNSITGTDAPTASPDKAVSVAETYINNNQPVAIQWARYQNQIVYAVGFANGELVLVNRAGNVVATQLVQ